MLNEINRDYLLANLSLLVSAVLETAVLSGERSRQTVQ
jgi:hypothetical protein